MGKLDGKVAIVTGAGQGVGQGIAYALAAEGAKVAVTGRTLAKVQATAAEIGQRGGSAHAMACDVKDASALAAMVGEVVAKFGGIDILVNNAQEVPLGPLLEVGDDALAAGWQSGPLATLRLMKLCHPHLKQRRGSIVNLGSGAAKRWDMSGYGTYGALKEAIRQLSRAAACEWGPDGIRTNVILPFANSPGVMWWTSAHPQEAGAFIGQNPLRRVGDCEKDIGRFVAHLCSDECGYVNGQSIGLDGGHAFLG